ncbi:MAG TPA: type VII secretion protein EccB, partial [Mycobacterium sp.]
DDALQALGLKNIAPRLAPWPLLQVWPAGPELSKQAAMTMHDTMTGQAAPMTEQGR